MTEKHCLPPEIVVKTTKEGQNANKLASFLKDMMSLKSNKEKAKVILDDASKLKDVNKELYKKVYDEKLIITSEKDKDGTDYAMMNYVLSLPHIFDSCRSEFDLIKSFWQQFFPHLDNFLNDYSALKKSFDETLRETDKIVLNQAGAIYEAKFIEAFMETKEGLRNEYEDFKKVIEKEHVHARKELQAKSEEKVK